jgi:hypothetical protein
MPSTPYVKEANSLPGFKSDGLKRRAPQITQITQIKSKEQNSPQITQISQIKSKSRERKELEERLDDFSVIRSMSRETLTFRS